MFQQASGIVRKSQFLHILSHFCYIRACNDSLKITYTDYSAIS